MADEKNAQAAEIAATKKARANKKQADKAAAVESDGNEGVGTGQIIYKLISELTLLETNPRLIGKTELNRLCNSLETDKGFFESRPCLINKVGDKLIVYAGNMRVRAALMLGWRLVPCIVDEIPSDLQDTRMFKDNIHYAEFDMAELLKTFDPAYLMHDIGMDISKKELSKLLKKDAEQTPSLEDNLNFDQNDIVDDDHLYIADKFTNGTKPAAFHHRQYEIPLAKETNEWMKSLVEDYKKKNKTTTTFMKDFRIAVQVGQQAERDGVQMPATTT